MNPSERGTWGEAKAVVWLMEHDYEVFTAFGNTSCDLVAVKDGLAYRVEVKVVTFSQSIYKVKNVDPRKHDWVLFVMPDGTVTDSPRNIHVGGTESTRAFLRSGGTFGPGLPLSAAGGPPVSPTAASLWNSKAKVT